MHSPPLFSPISSSSFPFSISTNQPSNLALPSLPTPPTIPRQNSPPNFLPSIPEHESSLIPIELTPLSTFSDLYRLRLCAQAQKYRVPIFEEHPELASGPYPELLPPLLKPSATSIDPAFEKWYRHRAQFIPEQLLRPIFLRLIQPKLKSTPLRVKESYSPDILQLLKSSYSQQKYPNESEKKRLSLRSGLSLDQINVWFTNKRSREKQKRMKSLQKSQPKPASPTSSSSSSSALLSPTFSTRRYRENEEEKEKENAW